MAAIPSPSIFEPIVRRALAEELGTAGDVTTDAIVPAGLHASASLIFRRAGRVAGLSVAVSAFRLLDSAMSVRVLHEDGSDVGAGDTIAVISGPARPLLTAERVALNVLGRASGIATATRDAVAAVSDFPATICCTRKTAPGLRGLDKYAVRVGGGRNHRFGLSDAILVKDNHILAAGGIGVALERVHAYVGHAIKVAVEVDTLAQLEDLLRIGADSVLFDNMMLSTLGRAVEMVDGRMTTEASGGITPDSVKDIAATGVDVISLGWLTHSVCNLDVSLEFSPI